MNDPSFPATLGRALAPLDAGLFVFGAGGFDVEGFGGAASSGFITRAAGGFARRGGTGKPPTCLASVGRV